MADNVLGQVFHGQHVFLTPIAMSWPLTFVT